MAETIISPGVFQRENDISFIQPAPVEAGAAIIGPTVKGPVEIPTIVTSFNDFSRKFGVTFESGSNKHEFLTSMAVKSYFEQGGNTCLVSRVVNGTFAAASSTAIEDAGASGTSPFTLETLGKGAIYNNQSGSVYGEENLDGSLISGSEDNLRFEISNVDSAKGTFTVSIRRGDDNTKSKVVLETFSNVSLDPNSTNYIERVIGNQTKTISGDSDQIEVTGEYVNNSNFVSISSKFTYIKLFG